MASVKELKKLSLEELFSLQVTTASRKPEPLSRAASAIDVITSERIHRSGATTIPDLLRLAAGMNVARFNVGSWAVGARGLNLNSSNKLQVMIDGRVLYTPLFSGVFWDVQDYLIDDIDRIEVVSGPGAALWGANAMNGVINIITEDAKQTQGTLFQAGGGTEEQVFGAGRYGGKFGESGYYRGYAKFFNRDGLLFANGTDAPGDWSMGRGGFRIDSGDPSTDSYTIQGDVYRGSVDLANRSDSKTRGGNLLAKWSRSFSPLSTLEVQAYYDRSDRKVPFQFQEKRNMFDLDLQHRLQIRDSNDLVWGFNYRASLDETENIGTIQFDPQGRTIHLFSGFIQDEITLVPEKWAILAGSKFEANSYTNLEVQPDFRVLFTPQKNQTLWGSISRAVRFPTRIDTDFRFFPVPGVLAIVGNPDFKPEELIAYQLGYRFKPVRYIFFDVVGFYHSYDDLISLEPQGIGQPAIIGNGINADIYGVTISTNIEPQSWLQVIGNITFSHKKVDLDPDSHDISNAAGEGNDPDYFGTLHTMIDPLPNLQLDFILRSVGELPSPIVPRYVTMDIRAAYRLTNNIELSVVGQNLFQKSHPEFGPDTPFREEVERGVYGRLSLSF
jgi:iron complex outermembrane receptor protein